MPARIFVHLEDGTWSDRAGSTVGGGTNPPPPDTSQSLFAGHVPNRVFVGMSSPGDGTQYRPGYTEAIGIIGQPVYAHREFLPTTYGSQPNWLDNTLTWNRDRGLYPVCTFKYPNWNAVRDGGEDGDWSAVRAYAKTQRTSGPGGTPQPFTVGFNHEPDGDGDLTVWGQAQIRMSNYMAGWTTNANGTKGTYNAANDVSDVMAWGAIFNGHWMGPKNFNATKVGQALPPLLTTTFRENRSLLMGDFYDPNPRNKDTVTDPNRFLQPYDYAANADRTSKKVQAFVDWARGRQAGAIGCGEFSATEGAEVAATWDVMKANRDIWAFTSYFNSAANSRWDWRLVPSSYPARNPDVFKAGVLTLRDFGGHPESQAKLDAFRVMLDESVSAAYTGPVL